jgi:hypothetical protein
MVTTCSYGMLLLIARLVYRTNMGVSTGFATQQHVDPALGLLITERHLPINT